MEFLNEFMLPVVLGICLCIGYIIKKWIKDVDNKYIKYFGVRYNSGYYYTKIYCKYYGRFRTPEEAACMFSGWQITPEVILSGMISGLGSTGMHQVFKQFVEKENK